jgi:glycosyltransferase involved in cell wall biosynthesis
VDTHASRIRSGGDDRPFVLAAFFDGEPTDGGGYVHKIGTLRVLRRLQGKGLEIVLICGSREALATVEAHGLRGVVQSRKGLRQWLGELSAMKAVRTYMGRSLGPKLSPVDRLLVRLGADLVFFAEPDRRALQLYSRSFIFSILDLAYLEHPEFPEVSLFGEFERREQLYAEVTRKAIAVITDSEEGRRLVKEQYRVPLSRIFTAPFLTSSSVARFRPDESIAAEVRKRYGLLEPYIFYPAQFWAHKNHRYIIVALRIMKERYGWAPQAVFCGSDKGMLSAVLECADLAGVRDLVNYCGFVPDGHIPYLYQGALALVMPTYFGPTNIPPVEALRLGIPVCYSDLPSFREQMGETVSYVDLEDPGSLAETLHCLRGQGRGKESRMNTAGEPRADEAEDLYFRVLEQIVLRFRRKTRMPVNG